MATKDIQFDFSADFPPPTEDQEKEVKEKCPDAARVTVHGIVFLARPPSAQQWQRFTESMGKSRVRAYVQLAIDCVAFPDSATLQKIMARFPVLPATLGDEISVLGGGDPLPDSRLL